MKKYQIQVINDQCSEMEVTSHVFKEGSERSLNFNVARSNVP